MPRITKNDRQEKLSAGTRCFMRTIEWTALGAAAIWLVYICSSPLGPLVGLCPGGGRVKQSSSILFRSTPLSPDLRIQPIRLTMRNRGEIVTG